MKSWHFPQTVSFIGEAAPAGAHGSPTPAEYIASCPAGAGQSSASTGVSPSRRRAGAEREPMSYRRVPAPPAHSSRLLNQDTPRVSVRCGAGGCVGERAGAQRWLPHPPPPNNKLMVGASGLNRRRAAGDGMAIYLVGLAVLGVAAWGSGKGASMEQGNLPRARVLPRLPLSWQTPCLLLGPRVCVPPVPQHCHPLFPPRCKAEHWDGQSSLAARGTTQQLGLGTPVQIRGSHTCSTSLQVVPVLHWPQRCQGGV